MFRAWILMAALAVAAAAQSAPPAAEPKFRISGTVVDSAHGSVLSGIEVSIALSHADTLLRTMITGPDGRFEFGDLAPTKYSLYARGGGYRPQGYQEHQRFITGIVTGPGLESEKLVFRLKPDASVSGMVTDEFNDPVPEAEVLLFGSITEAQQAVMVRSASIANDAGYFQLSHLREGRYYLVVTARRPWYARSDSADEEQQSENLKDSEAESSSVATDVSRHHHSEFDVSFPTTYYVNATEPELATPIILKPGDRATADVHLSAVPALYLKIRTGATFENASGSFTLRERIFNYLRQVAAKNTDQDEVDFDSLPPGHYMLESPPQGSGGLPQQQPLDLVTDLEIVPGESNKFASTVTGTVQLEDDPARALQRYSVRFVSLPYGEEFVADSTSKGFQISGGVRPGSYLVWVLNTENYLIKDISAVGAKVVGKQLVVPTGSAIRLSIVMTKESGTIDGIAQRDGKPVSDTAVFLVPNDPAHNLALFRGDQSDSDGSFTLRRILPGEYTVVAVAEGWDLEWTNPAAIRTYLPGGVKLRVQPGGKHQLKVMVQEKQGAPK